MRKNLVLGAADNYTWDQIKVWAISLRETGYTGDIALIAYRHDSEIVEGCNNLNIELIEAGSDEFGQPIDHHRGGLPTQAHKMRTFHFWQYLKECAALDIFYDKVIVNDTRDIYYQLNPDRFDSVERITPGKIYLPEEGVYIKDEPWNRSMIRNNFGPYVLEAVEQNPSCNSGTFFGGHLEMMEVFMNLYLICKNISATGSDQPALNVLYGLSYFFDDKMMLIQHDRGWACQCGTALDPTKPHLTELLTHAPIIRSDGIVTTFDDHPFVLVHQYDRVPQLKKMIEERYK